MSFLLLNQQHQPNTIILMPHLVIIWDNRCCIFIYTDSIYSVNHTQADHEVSVNHTQIDREVSVSDHEATDLIEHCTWHQTRRRQQLTATTFVYRQSYNREHPLSHSGRHRQAGHGCLLLETVADTIRSLHNIQHTLSQFINSTSAYALWKLTDTRSVQKSVDWH